MLSKIKSFSPKYSVVLITDIREFRNVIGLTRLCSINGIRNPEQRYSSIFLQYANFEAGGLFGIGQVPLTVLGMHYVYTSQRPLSLSQIVNFDSYISFLVD